MQVSSNLPFLDPPPPAAITSVSAVPTAKPIQCVKPYGTQSRMGKNIEVEYLPPNMTYILQAIYFQQYQLLIDY